MGWRFRKSTKIGPFRLNFSKRGIGWSVGAGGIRYTHRADGRRTVTSTIKGTGLSYVTDLGKAKPKPKSAPKVSQLPPAPKKPASSGRGLQKTKGFAGWVFVAGGLATLITLFSGDAEEIAEVGEVNLLLYMVVCFAVGVWLIRSAKRQTLISNLPEQPEPLEDDIEEASEVIPPDDRYEPRSEAGIVEDLVVRNRQDAEALAPQCLRQANETADILNNTTNPDTFFSRYDFLIGRLEVLSACEAYLSFTGENPSVTLARIGTKSFHEKASRQLIDRCFDKSCEKIASLKTERGKRNEAERFNQAFASCADYLNDALRQYQEEKYTQLVRIAGGEAAPALRPEEKTAEPAPSHVYDAAEAHQQTGRFEERYDLTTEEGIAAIPAGKEAFTGQEDVVSLPEQILSRKATEYKKGGRMDLAIACLKKANELRGPSPCLYTRADYERLVDYMVEAGRFEEARAEHQRLDQTLGSWEEELRQMEQACTDEAERQRYEEEVIPAQRAKMANREQYYWLRENLPDRAPKSFGAYCRMKNQNTATFQKLVVAAQEQGTELEKAHFWA